MRRRRWIVGLITMSAAVGAAARADADWLYVSKEGLPHLEEIRKAIQPAPLFQAGEGASGPWYVRGAIIDIIGPPIAEVRPSIFISYEEFLAMRARGVAFGTGVNPLTRLKIIAVARGGTPRSAPVELTAAWFVIVNEVDSARDVRNSFGNYDEAFGIEIGSRGYIEHLLAAIDDDGAMGLRPRGVTNASPRVPLYLGFATEQIMGSRKTVADFTPFLAATSREREARNQRLGLHQAVWAPGDTEWVRAIATARRQRFEQGVAEAIFGAVAAFLRLGVLEPGRFVAEKPFAAASFDSLTALSSGLIQSLISVAVAAVPGNAHPTYDGRNVWDAVQWISQELGWRVDIAGEETTARVLAEYKRRAAAFGQASDAPDHRTVHQARDPQLALDPSETAAVVLELLNETDALCFARDDQIVQLVDMAVSYERKVLYPDPRAADRVRLLPAARRLLRRLVTPPASGDPRVTQNCARTANAARRQLLKIAQLGVREHNSGERRFALVVLRTSGWAPKEEMDDFAWRFMGRRGTDRLLEDRKKPEPADPAAREAYRTQLARQADVIRVDAEVLSAILDLADAKEPHLRAQAEGVRRWMDAAVKNERGAYSDGDRYVVDQVNAVRKG